MRDALAVPYDRAVLGAHHEKAALVMYVRYIDQKLIRVDAEAEDTRDTLLLQLVEFMLQLTGVRASADTMVKEIWKGNG